MNSGNHIHIGPGKLGLGLVTPVMNELGFTTTLLARPNPKKNDIYTILQQQRGYQIREYDTGIERSINGINLIFFDKDCSDAIETIADGNTKLLTTAVTSIGLQSVAPLIAEGIGERVKSNIDSHLFVIACENYEQNSKKLKEEVTKHLAPGVIEYCENNVSFLNTIVDRICNELTNENGKIIVPVESWMEWIVNSSDTYLQPDFLRSPIQVVLEEDKFKFFEIKKAWLINGTHLAISIYGYINTIFYLKEVIKNRNILNEIKLIQQGFVIALNFFARANLKLNENELPEITIPSLEKHATKMLERIEIGPNDTIDRILKNLLQLRDIKRYLGKPQGDMPNTIDQKDIKSILQLTDMSLFFMKSYGRICDPVSHLLDLDKNANGLFFSSKPEIVRAILNYFIYSYYVIKKRIRNLFTDYHRYY